MNKTLRLVLALVLCLVMVFALTACEKHDCEKDGHEFVEGVCKHCGEEEKTGGDLPEGLPVAEGKVTFYLTLVDITLEARNSIWLCGPMNYTAESTDFGKTAVEMVRLGETNVYYYQYDVAAVEAGLTAAANPGEYQLVLGWNANSGAAAEKQGVNWSFKFDQTTSDLDNPSWAELYTAGTTSINLGEVKFSCGQPGAPVKLEKVTFQVELTEALPEGWVVVMPGSHAAWEKNDTTVMTPSADRKTWSLEVTNIYEGTYEYKLVAAKADGNMNWANTTVGAGGDNETVSLTGMDNNHVVDLRGEPATFDAAIFAAAVATNSTLTVTFSAALEEGVQVALPGAFNGWSPENALMTPNADRTVWSITVASASEGDQFKVIVIPQGNTVGWGGGNTEYGNGGDNFVLSVAEAGDGLTIAALAEPLVYPVPAAE